MKQCGQRGVDIMTGSKALCALSLGVFAFITTAESPSALQGNTTGTFGQITYTTPAGWKAQVFSDGVSFQPADLPAGDYLAVQLLRPATGTAPLERVLALSYDDAAAMFKATKMNEMSGGNYRTAGSQKSFGGLEYIRGKGSVNIAGAEYGFELFIVKLGNRFERVLIVGSRNYCRGVSRYFASDRVVYREAIEELLYSLRFADSGLPAVTTGSIKGSGATGVWQGTIQGTGAAVGLRLEVFTPIFLTNGQVYFGPTFPLRGLDGVDTRVPAELNRRDWGSYVFDAGRGVLNMPYGDIPFRIEGQQLIVTKNQRDWPFFRLAPVDGAVFNGTYMFDEDNGQIPSITFSPDGRFVDNGALRVMSHERNECLNPAAKPGSGRYDVRDYSVTFTYSDGRRVKLAFLGAEYSRDNPSPPTLRMSYNEDKLVRR
jgi:hypothetical protein